MQIRLTVVDPLGPPSPKLAASLEQGVSPSPRRPAARCDVLVTAPAGTALSAVASALAAAVAGDGGTGSERGGRERGAAERNGRERGAAERGGRDPGAGPVVLYAGAERLDAQRCTLGEPPLLDGAVLSLGAPAEPEPHPELDDAPTQLHVVAGPDAGGVHLLHGGQITVGRSADAGVPLDDPDVSRVHCAVTVAPDGGVSVADLGSTNGTVLDGRQVGARPVRFTPGALLRIGESALRLTPAAGPGARVATAPDGEGHVRVASERARERGTAGVPGTAAAHARVAAGGSATDPAGAPAGTLPSQATGETRLSYGSASWGASGDAPGAQEHAALEPPAVPAQGRASRIEGPGGGDTHAGRFGAGDRTGAFTTEHAGEGEYREYGEHGEETAGGPPRTAAPDGRADGALGGSGRKGTPLRGTEVPQGLRRRGGLGAWARRLAGGRGEQTAARHETYGEDTAAIPADARAREPGLPPVYAGAPQLAETWPDPAALLLTALGPGPRLWERGPGHPEALTVRLGTADRAAPDGSGRLLPAVPVTADLREVRALGLAGPRARLSGLARAVVSQLAALHSPDTLEIVLLCTDRARPLEERVAEWSWLGWLPHVRPVHGQDCRLLLAHDREQATARTDELLRRLDDHLAETGGHARGQARRSAPGEARSGAPALRTHPADDSRAAARRPSWARDDDIPDEPGFAGPYTVVVVDGDPGGTAVREAVARLAHEGPRAGIHVVCLAEAAPASPASPVTETYEAACAVSPVFRECGAVALLSGDVATALRLMRVAHSGTETPRPGAAAATQAPAPAPTAAPAHGPGVTATSTSAPATVAAPTPTPVPPGTVAVVDAVSLMWAERFGRALAPLRTDTAAGDRPARVSAPLPQSARLLDELGLARATPASLQARWADAADDAAARGGRAWAILGAGPRGPVCADLVADGPHLLVEGPAGSGRTELLRSVVASLAAAERPDRLGVVLLDGRDCVGSAGGSGDGLKVCTDVPHVTTHLTANDPVRMREFAQSLSAELKRRAELLGRSDFAEWHTGREVSGRIVAQRTPNGRGTPGPTPPARGASPASPADTRTAGAGPAGPGPSGTGPAGPGPSGTGPAGTGTAGTAPIGTGAADLDTPPSSTLRLRPAAARARAEATTAPPLPRLVVVVDDLDALVSPALGSPGRPAAGSVIRALEAVAREGGRLGVHLVASAMPGGRTAETEPARRAALRVTLDAPATGPDEPAPGRGRLTCADGRVTAFQGGRVTGRIPRTATQRPTVVPLEWHRMGDPPARRSVRELGNGPTDLALLASALERAAREVSAAEVPSLL
ncbi:FHA domain-containing protein [Streptomyces sp. NPDC020801]|uniref:FHA domain-containing protein n=1 Tax=Streptomyces sp. NPDC020801 TaxID=3365093 RepID=UPI00378EE2E2